VEAPKLPVTLCSALASDSRLQLVRIDYQNAFNTVSRTAVLQAVALCAPELLPFVQWVYSCPLRLWEAGREEGAPAILSMTGVGKATPWALCSLRSPSSSL
jgi:hypothetical protein